MTPTSPDRPFFTVVIPTCRREAVLEVAIHSALQQTFGDFELLVVDDVGSVRTEMLVTAFRDPRVRYLVSVRGRGGAGARNTGILAARGAWVAFLDDDDAWLPRKLERLAGKIRAAADDLGLVYTAHASYDFERCDVLVRSRPGREGWLHDALLYENFIGGFSAVAVRRELLLALGGLDERFPALQDADLYLRVARRARIGYVDEVLTHVRKNLPSRISLDADRRLAGLRLYWYKYRDEFASTAELRYRIAARVFLQAISAGAPRAVAQSLGWTLSGFIVAPEHARETARLARRHVAHRLQRARTRRRLLPAIAGRRETGTPG